MQWATRGNVAILSLRDATANAISADTCSALIAGVQRADSDDDVAVLVVACAGPTFDAGEGFAARCEPSLEQLTAVIDTLDASVKPVVAAIQGTVLGVWLEIALGCHYRVSTADAWLGLPDVKLGLMPRACGTQHLPRLVGVAHSLDMIALGELVDAQKAWEIGLLDTIVEGDLVAAAISLSSKLEGKQPRRTRDLVAAPVSDSVYKEFAQQHARKFRGLDAPPAIIASIKVATQLPFAEGVARERELLLQLDAGPQSAALRHVFFAEREAANLPDLSDINPRGINSAGVIGSGTMGSGIAIALLSAGMPVILYERDAIALERGMGHIHKTISSNVARGRLTRAQADKALANFVTTTDIASLASADLVIEAAYETLAVKREIFAALEIVAPPGAILASNTSYLDIDEIAAATSRPQDVIGLHFFSPANVMKLLEVIPGKATAPDVIATAFNIARRMQKIAVLSGNAWGFIGNRMLAVRRREAEAMAVQGASPSQIDRVIERFGLAMGPFRVGDLAGLDLGWSAEKSTGSTIRERLCEAGRRGQKTCTGFYDYDKSGAPIESSIALEIIAAFARDNGIVQRVFNDDEVLDRLLWPMVDEGAKILAEGVALKESDIDVVWVNGYGWPAWTGGPMFYGRQTGYAQVIARLEDMGMQASPALKALARKQ